MHQGVERLRAMGVGSLQSYFLGLQAEAYGDSGQGKKGLKVVAEALDRVHTTGERFFEAELHRIKGILLLGAGNSGPGARRQNSLEAETCFQQAIEIARRQQAKSLELRAATSLARLWQQKGKKAKARNLLTPVYGWFTEGFDTADVRDARALLEELG